MSYKRVYEQNLKAFRDTMNLKEPEFVLVGSNFTTSQIGYVGGTVMQCIENPDYYITEVSKFYKDFEIDILTLPLVNPLEAIWAMGRDTYFIGEDEITVQHKESVPMLEDEYPQLIKDPLNFIVNTLFPRKFPALLQDEQPYERLKKAALSYKKFRELNGKFAKHVQEHYGVLAFIGGKLYVPFDVIFDRLRGIRGSLIDIHRQAENVIAACEALMQIYIKPLQNLNSDIPHAYCTLHAPTYLSTKDYEKFFWPYFKRMLMYVYEKGSKATIHCQGKWDRFFDYFLELPKGMLRVQVEKDDIISVKKRIGHHHTVEGGIPLTEYRYKSKEELIDMAKRILDECAPEGGFIFSMDQTGLSNSDVFKDKMQAVYHFVHEYH